MVESGYEVAYDSRDDVIRLVLRGRFDAQTLNESTKSVLAEMERVKCYRILMDHREAIPRMPTIDIYSRPSIAQEMGVPRTCSIAIVFKEPEEEYRLLENVAVNNGYMLKVFTEIGDAKRWLKEL